MALARSPEVAACERTYKAAADAESCQHRSCSPSSPSSSHSSCSTAIPPAGAHSSAANAAPALGLVPAMRRPLSAVEIDQEDDGAALAGMSARIDRPRTSDAPRMQLVKLVRQEREASHKLQVELQELQTHNKQMSRALRERTEQQKQIERDARMQVLLFRSREEEQRMTCDELARRLVEAKRTVLEQSPSQATAGAEVELTAQEPLDGFRQCLLQVLGGTSADTKPAQAAGDTELSAAADGLIVVEERQRKPEPLELATELPPPLVLQMSPKAMQRQMTEKVAASSRSSVASQPQLPPALEAAEEGETAENGAWATPRLVEAETSLRPFSSQRGRALTPALTHRTEEPPEAVEAEAANAAGRVLAGVLSLAAEAEEDADADNLEDHLGHCWTPTGCLNSSRDWALSEQTQLQVRASTPLQPLREELIEEAVQEDFEVARKGLSAFPTEPQKIIEICQGTAALIAAGLMELPVTAAKGMVQPACLLKEAEASSEEVKQLQEEVKEQDEVKRFQEDSKEQEEAKQFQEEAKEREDMPQLQEGAKEQEEVKQLQGAAPRANQSRSKRK
eukprot:TRINITY_DN4382_c0_g1_i16.p1 TRINITY_DN4382_c0_g1~~TRINITY_DN4382_c0_g1_i16.p1  ORF type:complete len:566 (-),score=175.93 TRINITY_DN4382_c0_g1_i16:224-1921(-)